MAQTTPVASDSSPLTHSLQEVTIHTTEVPVTETRWQKYKTFAEHYLPKIVVAALTIQGLLTLYKSLYFILATLPAMEQQLAQHLIEEAAITELVNKAVIEILWTILHLAFAVRISIVHTKAAKMVSTALGILIVLGEPIITSLLNQYGSEELFTTKLTEFIRGLFSFGRDVETNIQREIPAELRNLQ